ncbi:MORC family CW-type zinc finger protein 3 [Acropora cervicornis]|uniref:MORC family CW-type zinc finger protein 3 n=1 Tax=Acropora cervicornis TaxID=6130 RepID=A0AAD9PWQ2_ACRCE|nr:MORC family CW-type zinc finger protein 3 [Acropora cervicornis]
MATGSSVDSPDAGVRLSTLSPKYLHTNSTSHTWPFSAIAELIDNAYDPDVNASQLWIDVKKYPKHNYCLVFTDYGAGMGPEKLHKMLSFGFCDKVAKKGQHMPVGHYGNGFKSGSMRLGRDAIVFTKNANSKSVGFLSQTYLDAIKAETILVPMVTWDTDGNILYVKKLLRD